MKGGALLVSGLAALAVLAIAKGGRASAPSSSSSSSPLWIPSPNFSAADRKPGDVRLIVIHTMQAPKTPTAAIDGARNWFALPSSQVSSHYLVDSDHVVQAVKEHDVAWHAKGGNAFSIGIEHAGSAAESSAEWADAYNDRMLERSAELAAGIAKRWGLPVVWRTADEVKAGAKGICGHKEITDAFLAGQGHGDPGPGFPRAEYMERVRRAT